MGRYYRVGEVAALTQVSVRTLHHYDRIGLLRPALHSAGGYRMYGESELLRLQQILTLRYLGFPLKRIGDLLDRADFDLVASLRVQGQALHDRIAELERISAAIGELVDQRLATGEWSWQLVIEASQAVGAGLTRGEEMMDAYYTPEQMKRVRGGASGDATGRDRCHRARLDRAPGRDSSRPRRRSRSSQCRSRVIGRPLGRAQPADDAALLRRPAGCHQGQLRTGRVRGTRSGAASGGLRVHRARRGRPRQCHWELQFGIVPAVWACLYWLWSSQHC